VKIVLAGATGFIGTPLRQALIAQGHQLIVLVRTVGSGTLENGKSEKEQFVPWDGQTEGEWVRFLDGVDAVINLAGENIASRRWTPGQKQKILSSRIDATRAIVRAIEKTRKRPRFLINVSAVGYYGDQGDKEVSEESLRGRGFLADVCEKWESEARRAELSGVRVVLPRLAPVLARNGGMLSKMAAPFRFFLGGPLGSGKQWMPWVHREDVIGAFLFFLENQSISGPVNIAAPVYVTMKEFCLALGEVLHRPSWIPVPALMLRFLMGEMADMVLCSQRVIPSRLLQAGYPFRYPGLFHALSSFLGTLKC